MFSGESTHKLDAKGRLFVPRRFLEEVSVLAEKTKWHVVKAPDGCLQLLTPNTLRAMVQGVRQKNKGARAFQREKRNFMRLTEAQPIDSQGRILLSEKFREYAEIKNEVVVVGTFDEVEIWSAVRWAEQCAHDEQNAADTSDYFMGDYPDPEQAS